MSNNRLVQVSVKEVSVSIRFQTFLEVLVENKKGLKEVEILRIYLRSLSHFSQWVIKTKVAAKHSNQLVLQIKLEKLKEKTFL